MPTSDKYTFKSGSVAVAATTATPVISVFGTAAKRLWVQGCRVKVGVTAAAVGNDLLFQLARPANTPTGTGLASGSAHDFSAPASLGQFAIAWSTAPTLGVVVAEWVVAQTTGTAWLEYPPTDDEWGIPAIANGSANAGLHLFVTPTVATSTPVYGDLICSE